MSLGSTIGHVLGIVAGFLIPGANKGTANLTAAVQQELADKMGDAATDLAERLKTDTTGMTGMQKVFAISNAMIEEAKSQGFKGDVKILEAVALDVAQAAYRKSIEPEIAAGITAIAAALHASPLVMVGVGILAQYVQGLADAALPATAPAAQAA